MFPDGLFYNVHAPCIYNKEKFAELKRHNWMGPGQLIKSTYFNSYPCCPVEMRDPKQVKGLFYSTGERVGSDEKKMLDEMFNVKSKFEL